MTSSLDVDSILDVPQVYDTAIADKSLHASSYGLEKVPLFIAAPMVRYSNVAFRRVVKAFGCDIVYSSMTFADAMGRSRKHRISSWGHTIGNDRPIIQFAASNGVDFGDAVEQTCRYVSGIDLNCGCPKSDVRGLGCGSALLTRPELIADIVHQGKARLPSDINIPFSAKLRILRDDRATVEMCQMLEKAGIDRIALHTRIVEDGGHGPTQPGVVSVVKSAIRIPLYVNGGVQTMDEALALAKDTQADGVMVANGLLSNPALFLGYSRPSSDVISMFVREALSEGISFDHFHQHLVFMLRMLLGRRERQNFNNCSSVPHMLTFLRQIGVLESE